MCPKKDEFLDFDPLEEVPDTNPNFCEVCHNDDGSLDINYLNAEAVCDVCGNDYDSTRRDDGSCSRCKEHTEAICECPECGVVYIRDNDNWAVRR